ncbi:MULTISPECIES: hypothetical protein [unclassified Rhodococcus (in: high G+C Gram-positive bacteria)]|uniref:hypothetical protein n=1 Tax=unclassified Rhodococcus (in: high G+C Gram-positive bacteria) TaxID=192944 RepID=UPI003396CF29
MATENPGENGNGVLFGAEGAFRQLFDMVDNLRVDKVCVSAIDPTHELVVDCIEMAVVRGDYRLS